MKVLVKDRETLNRQLEEFIETVNSKGGFPTEEGFLSESGLRESSANVYDFVAGKELEVEKIFFKDGSGFRYSFPWFFDGKQCYGSLDETEVEKELCE